jgi:hypothetical protein
MGVYSYLNSTERIAVFLTGFSYLNYTLQRHKKPSSVEQTVSGFLSSDEKEWLLQCMAKLPTVLQLCFLIL